MAVEETPSASPGATTDHTGQPSARDRPQHPRSGIRRGDLLERYLVLDVIGEGGGGTVFEAHDPDLDRNVAIKVLHRRGAVSPAALAGRLLGEAKAMARLSHPNVVVVHDVGTHRGGVFVAMERVEGVDLAKWLQANRPRWPAVTRMFVQAGRGLAAAHAAGLVHGDFKPANVLVGPGGSVRVGDFGLAGVEDDPRGLRGGTPLYMAPELQEGRAPDAKSDQYAFCVALLEALTGRSPRADAFRWAAVPGPLRRLLRRGLGPDPAARHPSMEVLLRRLERALGHRRRIAGGLLALGGLAAIAAWPEETPDCEPSLRVRESWSPERRAEIEAALAAASTRSSTSRVTGVMAEVDGWVERWRESYVRVCEATLVERIQSEALLDARMMCLDRDRAELDALLAVFEAADAEVAQRAVPAVGRLRRPEDCRHQGAELLAMAPPEPAPRIEVEAVRQVLHRVRALHEAGKYERAHVLAVAALRRATATGFAPVRVEAQLRLGMALGKIGQYTQAETELATAHWDAEAIRHEDVATTAAIELVFLLGDRQQRAADARLWGSHADAARRRAGSQSRHEADLLNAVGAAHTTAGAYDEALEAFDRSLEIKRRLYGEHHYEVAMALGNIGNVLDNRGQADRARDYLERSVSMCETLLGSDHPTVGLMVGNLAGVVHHQAQFSEARALYERAIEIKQAALGPDHPSVAFAIDGLGVTLQRLGDYDGAARAHRRALEIAIERLGPEHPFVAAAWTNLGNTHVTTGDHPAARHAFEQALAINVARMGEHHAAVSSPLMGLGVVALAEGDLDGATRYHEQALRAVTQHLGSEDWRVGLAESNLGLVAHRKGAKDRAREHYERARNVLEASLPPEHPDRRVLAERIAALEETP